MSLPSWGLVGATRVPFGGALGHPGTIWESPGAIVELLEAIWGNLGPSWGHLEPPWGHLGAAATLSPIWNLPRAILEPSGALLGPSRGLSWHTDFYSGG